MDGLLDAPARERPGEHDRATGAGVLWLFTLTTFLGAGLVFLVQPMVAKMLLPLLGGTPAVWNTAMVFFQAALLAGYAYAHVSTRALGVARQARWHLGVLLLPALALPIALPAGWSPPLDSPPALWLLLILTVTVGLPYFAVTTASPLLQRWFTTTDHPQAADPYFLYAAGNAGSLLALLAYPLLLEPAMTLAGQARLWAILYAAFAILAAACVVVISRRSATQPPDAAAAATGGETEAAPVPLRRKLRWVAYAFVPSSLMLGTTLFISTDIAAVPLLWVLPLSIYLLTFILAFARMSDLWVAVARWTAPPLVLVVAALFLGLLDPPLWVIVVVHLATLFMIAVLAHGRLAQERPATGRLTEFYLLIAVGGVLGGIFNALLAPLLFRSVMEYPVVIAAAMVLLPARTGIALLPARWRWAETLAVAALLYHLVANLLGTYQEYRTGFATVGVAVVIGLALLAALMLASRPWAFAAVAAALLATALIDTTPLLFHERTFYGVYQVYESEGRRVLMHGTTIHGYQDTDRERARIPLSYHHPEGPLGEVFAHVNASGRGDRVAVVGLGVGTMAAYGQPGQHYDFYEIDPAVVGMATDRDLFTYVSDSPAEVGIIVGDGRLTLAQNDDARYGVIMLNAFTSDAIPVHLLTRQAMQLYVDRLEPGGLLVFNVTNRYLAVEPVVTSIADSLGLATLARYDSDADWDAGRSAAHWVLVARDAADFGPLRTTEGWYRPDGSGVPVWTDTYTNILGVYDWRY